MGRTVLSFRMLLEEMIVELSVFRRALRGEKYLSGLPAVFDGAGEAGMGATYKD